MHKLKAVWRLSQDYLIVGAVVLIGLFLVLQLWRSNLAQYPLQYGMGDDMTAAMTMKSMKENLWYYENPLLGAPNPEGTNSYDATTGEVLLNLMQLFLVLITQNWVLALNLFYLSGYFLCAWTALFTLKKLNISRLSSIVGSVLYSFLPYHFFHGMSHLYLSEYFMVPLMVYLVVKVIRGDRIWEKKSGRFVTWNNIGSTILVICMALTGVYYAYFTCFFLCVCLLYKLVNRVSWRKCWQEVLCIGIISLSLLIAMCPSIFYWLKNGRNLSAIVRSADAAEIYSMKLSQLILPISGHRISKLAELRSGYDGYLLSNENTTVSLGLIMALGFIILLICLFAADKRKTEYQLLHHLSVLNLSALLIGTIGSFSTIIGFFVSMIRCYNRICVFIAMFSIITCCVLLDRLWKRWSTRKGGKLFCCVGFVCVLIFGMWDQTSANFVPDYEAIRSEFDNDDAFVSAIESINAEGIIFQMPYVEYPEQGSVNNMVDYSHLRGYLHSNTLRWSYAAVKGRETDAWQKSVAELQVDEQLVVLVEHGFTGIYVDSFAYTEEEMQKLQTQLETFLGQADIVSENGRFYYYDLNE